jgi:hypothetical protein
MSEGSTVQIVVSGGPTIDVPWSQGMNVQQALEGAYNQVGQAAQFTFALQFYGQFGYLVMMINETYDSFISSAAPYFYWELLVNGAPSQTGIDSTILNAGDVVTFSFETYSQQKHEKSTLKAKYEFQKRVTGK